MKNKHTLRLVIAALCLALAMLLPRITAGNQMLGSMLLPMHIPVLLCGFICGPLYGCLCGAAAPILCAFLFGAPPIFPTAVAMMAELAAYGVISALLFKKTNVFISLIGAMIGGRIINGLANLILLSLSGRSYTFEVFIAGAFLNAWPGIIIQLILIPVIIINLSKADSLKGLLKHG